METLYELTALLYTISLNAQTISRNTLPAAGKGTDWEMELSLLMDETVDKVSQLQNAVRQVRMERRSQ